MAILKKSSFPENLDAYSVLVKDTDPSSRYFRITDLPDTFTGGKNSFLIQGSEELVPDTVVKVEIKDSKGNIIYTEPGEGIPEYYEGVSKPVAVYVYPDTAFGPCTITILGELDTYEVDGQKRQVPTEWKGKYNIRWQKTVQVNPVLTNSSKIRFYRRPKVNITESVLPIFNRSVTRRTISGSVQGVAVIPAANTNLRSFKGDTLYELYATSSIFSASMEGETITLTGLPREHSTAVRDVVNDSKLSIEIPYYETSSASPIAPQIVKNFTNASFTMSFNEAVNLTSSSLFSSFAKITLTDLEAFSGDPSRLKVFSKRKADIGNYTLLEDIKLESSEILIADSFSGSVDVRTGEFAIQGLVDYYWVYQDPQTSTLYTPTIDSSLLANSVKLQDAGTDNTVDFPQRIFFYSHSISFTKDTEYELDFIPLLSSSAYLPAQLEIYVSGAAFADTNSNKRLGKRLGQFIHDTDFRRYDLQQFNFKPDSDGTGTVLFAVYQGNWQISNIGLRASQETNFSPNEVRLNITMPTVVKNDTYDFRFEFYDVNNNYVPVLVEKEYTFTGGTDLSNLGGASASIFAFKPDSTIFPFGYNNNYDFQEVNTFASSPIGATEINFSIQKTNITGDVLIGSSAFDSGGAYIDPALYAAALQPYPGLLTSVTPTSAILTVDNFTGSLANIEVKRIQYTASVSSYTDLVNIFKVVEGTPGSDGNNGLQYVIRSKTGNAIKNSDPTTYLEVQIVKIDATNPSISSVTDVTSGNVKLVTGSFPPYQIVNAGNGVVAGTNGVNYNAQFYASKIEGSLVVGAYDFDQNILVDTITLADITDGITTGFIEASNGLILKRLTDNTYTPANTALTASFFDAKGMQYSQSILVTANYSSADQLKYQTGIDDPNINLDYVRTVGGTPMSNNVYTNTQGLTAKFTFTEPNTGQQISVTEGVAIATDGTKGANSITTVITPPTQTVRKNVSLSSYGTPVTYFIQLLETGSALTYTSTNPPASNGQWTLQVASGNGTNNSVNGTKSGSITPPSVASDSGVTSSFAYRYRDSNGNLSDFISGSHYVGVVFDGQDGQNVGDAGQNAIEINIQPSTQTVSRNPANQFGTPTPFTIYVSETGSLMTYTTNDPPASIGEWTIAITTGQGTNGSTAGAKSGSITPPTPTTSTPLGTSSSFAIKYKNSKGTVSQYLSQSYFVGVSFDGVNGPGVVFTGVWQSGRVYQFDSGSSGRRDVVLWSRTGNEPYNSYFGTLRAHTSDGTTGATGNGAPNYSTGSVGSAWLELGQESFFVAAKIGLFEESFVKNTINVGSTNNGGVAAANITIAGSGSYPYISIGQADSAGSQGYGLNGIFLGAVKDTTDSDKRKFRMSLVTGSNYLKWDGDGRLLISGTISASQGNIGGVTILDNKIFTGAGTYANTNTPFYIASGSTNIFSLADKLAWNGSTLSVNGSITVTGGNAATNTNLSSSLNDSVLSASLYAANAAASASVSGSSSLYSSLAQLQVLANGGYSGSFIGGTSIYSPSIGGQNGYISGTLLVGSASNGITIEGPKKRIYIGAGNYNNADTTFYVASGSTNIFSLADKLSWNGSTLSVNGNITVAGGNAATNSNLSSSLNDSVLSASLYAANAAASASVSGSSSLYSSLAQLQVLANGGYSGSFIGGTAIYSPSIGGQNGYISGTLLVGSASNGITIDGPTKRIFIGAGNYANANTTFYVASGSTNIFSLADKLTWNGSTLYVSGTVSASAGAIGGVFIDNSRLYLGTGIFSSSATPFFISSSGRFSLGDTVIYEPTTRQLTVSGTLAADSITAREIQNINFGIDKGVDFRSGSIGGWTLQDGRILSNNTSMSIDSNNSSITIYSGSTDSAGVKQPTISIKPGGLTGLSATSSLMAINNLSTSTQNLSTNSPYTATTILLVSGSNSIMTIATDKQGTYVGAVSASAIAGTALTLTSWKGSVQLNLNVQVSTSPTFDTLLETVNVGNATYITDYTTPVTTTVGFTNKSTAQPLTVTFPTAGTYYARATWYFKALFYGGGSVSVSTITSTVSNPNRLQQQVSLSEISDGGMQVIYNSSRYVKIPRASSGTMLEVGGDITATGNITAYFSDERLKTILGIIDNPLQKINRLKGIYYIQNELAKQLGYEDDRQQIGLIAQDVQEVLPETIDLAPIDNDGQGNSKTGENYLTIHYERVIPLLVEAIKELTRQVEELKQNK